MLVAKRRIRWPVLVATLLVAGGVGLLLAKPGILASAATHLINRQLKTSVNGHLRVGSYRVRPFAATAAA